MAAEKGAIGTAEPRSNGAVTTEELERTPAGIVKRWVAEIDRSSRREKDWREDATKVYDRYRGKQRGKNSYNILFANTETLRPAIYNSTPKPDVRRRYADEDIVAKLRLTDKAWVRRVVMSTRAEYRGWLR